MTSECTHPEFNYWGYASNVVTHYGPDTVFLYECTQCGQISSLTLSDDITLHPITNAPEGTHETQKHQAPAGPQGPA